jgi:hypothetical protein
MIETITSLKLARGVTPTIDDLDTVGFRSPGHEGVYAAVLDKPLKNGLIATVNGPIANADQLEKPANSVTTKEARSDGREKICGLEDTWMNMFLGSNGPGWIIL